MSYRVNGGTNPFIEPFNTFLCFFQPVKPKAGFQLLPPDNHPFIMRREAGSGERVGLAGLGFLLFLWTLSCQHGTDE
ncbi:unnamed protein product [Pararhodospirillum photometricum DSM 122]|uniref:Uncharacterized protein n=1 Tax=Pararhodospirillum photometricum DSM 122 TaxID=1150469 RepID=H6SPF0_PARPM|nr:unnamed protein product [Pararhodospirillum photometricum DSM 122]